MKVAVTGGAGFIGSHIVDACLAAGHDVIVVDDLSTGYEHNLNPAARFARLDIRDRAAVAKLMAYERPAAISHQAAQMDVRRSVADPVFDAEVNVLGLLNLLEEGRRHGLAHVVFASSGGTVYGDNERLPAREGDPTVPLCPYGVTKLATENYLHYYSQVYGIRHVALRYANVYGPRQDPKGEAGVVAIFTGQLLRGEAPVITGAGTQTRDYVYVGDVARANRLALESDFCGPVNVGTGCETDVNRLFALLRAATGVQHPERHGPAKIGEQLRSALDPSRARAVLGWEPSVPLAEGLAKTVAYFRERMNDESAAKPGMTSLTQIRNFSIIAHIDHGKSTLADRLMERTGTITERERTAQLLDSMDLERERGITIKASAVRMHYRARDGQEYLLNLIDTPGHVDFGYEVSRSLSACEGAVLVVDAAQGVEAQTLANVYQALDHNLEILPVINKIDLPSAEPERVKQEIEEIIGLDASGAVLASAKQGLGIDEVLEGIVHVVPPPTGAAGAPLKALIFDSWFDPYHGVVAVVRVFDGSILPGERVMLMSNGKRFQVTQVGVFAPRPVKAEELGPGDVGFFMAAVKDIHDANIGDTVTSAERPTAAALPGFKAVKPMVFSGLYPTDSIQYEPLRDAMEKLRLNDSAFSYEPESSIALGFGFRCGFLGLLHMDIVRQRLEREFALSLIATAPTVAYRVTATNGEVTMIDSPAKLPPEGNIEQIEEPYILGSIHVPESYLGGVLKLCEDKRGRQRTMRYLGLTRVVVEYELPLNEVVLDFHDRLKSVSKGYASLDYEFLDLRPGDLVKLDVRVNGEPVDALSLIVHRERAYQRGREVIEAMKGLIPRQMFEVVLQAAIGAKIIARETVRALRKNVTAKCYGGDISRKRKLLERQKEGKKRMKQVGQVEIPQEAFLAVLKVPA